MFSSQESKKLATLPTDTTHYLIPFSDVATKFMDVIEFEQLSGVIFPQTVVNEIQQSSLKHYRFSAAMLYYSNLCFCQENLQLHQKYQKWIDLFPQ